MAFGEVGCGEAARHYGHKPLGLQRCTKSGLPKLISHQATGGSNLPPGWTPLLPPVSSQPPAAIFPVPFLQPHRSKRLLVAPDSWIPWLPDSHQHHSHQRPAGSGGPAAPGQGFSHWGCPCVHPNLSGGSEQSYCLITAEVTGHSALPASHQKNRDS